MRGPFRRFIPFFMKMKNTRNFHVRAVSGKYAPFDYTTRLVERRTDAETLTK